MADINELIGGYKLRTLLQTGQHSQVFEVVEPTSNRHFAMKLLLPEAAANPEQRRNLFHEAEVGIKLTHQNVIRIYKVNRSPTNPHFIMEFFPSGSLRLRLQAKDFKFIQEHSRRIFKEAATGLAYMNATGYVHRDVKPDNILVNSVGDTKLIDFAISKKMASGFFEKLLRKRGRPQGTPSFMSPEQIRNEALDGRADIYSYGCTLYELTTGRPPFRGSTQRDLLSRHLAEKPAPPSAFNKDLTDEFAAFVVRLLAKKREDRPANFHEVLIQLQKVPQIYKSVPEKRAEDGEPYPRPEGGRPAAAEAGPAPESEAAAAGTDDDPDFDVEALLRDEGIERQQPAEPPPEAPPPEPPDTVCLDCKHRWKLVREPGVPPKCVNCGAAKERLRRLK
jgi:serine/threonine protein kinase